MVGWVCEWSDGEEGGQIGVDCAKVVGDGAYADGRPGRAEVFVRGR